MNITVEGKSKEILDEFLSLSRELVGVYFDATVGFYRNKTGLEKDQLRMYEEFKKDNPDYTLEELDKAAYAYGEGDPNVAMPNIFHYSTQKEYKQRNSEDGRNYQFIGNMCLITIYQYWEDFYRSELAKSFSIDKDDLKSDLFGDIRLIWHSIIHHKSIALEEINRCKLLKWFSPGENIFIDKEKLLEVINNIQHFSFSFVLNKNK